jgi:hypothetical protein
MTLRMLHGCPKHPQNDMITQQLHDDYYRHLIVYFAVLPHKTRFKGKYKHKCFYTFNISLTVSTCSVWLQTSPAETIHFSSNL